MNLDLLSPTQTRKILEELNHQPRKNLGQNFLIDGNIVSKSLRLAEVQPDDTVIEVGPGLGTLTRGLLSAGARLFAVERDPTLAQWLRDSLGDHPAFHLIEGDACDTPVGTFQHTPGVAYKIVANLPYAISSPWMEAVLQQDVLPSRIVVLVQKETADRMTAEPGSKALGSISIYLEGAYQRLPGHRVQASCFYPIPKVDSALFHLSLKDHPYRYSKACRDAIRLIFTLRRKQVGSSAKKFLPEPAYRTWMEALPDLGTTPQARPETLPFPAWRRLDSILLG